jgi:hypothetical protein
VQRLIASCLNDACRHTALIDVSGYPAEIKVRSFGRRAVCGACRLTLAVPNQTFSFAGGYWLD